MKFSVDVENISKILFLDFIFFENMSLKNISAWLGGNLLLRLLPETVVAGHILLWRTGHLHGIARKGEV